MFDDTGGYPVPRQVAPAVATAKVAACPGCAGTSATEAELDLLTQVEDDAWGQGR